MQMLQTALGRYLLKPIILLSRVSHPGPHVGYILREQGMHQTHELASRQNEGTFVLVLGDFLILAPVVGFVLQVVLAEQVGSQNEIVAQVDVADFGQTGVLGDKFAGGTLAPSQAHVLSQVLVLLKTKDVDDLGQDAGGDDRPQALDGDDGIGNGVDVASDCSVETFHGTVQIADVIPNRSQRVGDHLVHARVDGVGGAQCVR